MVLNYSIFKCFTSTYRGCPQQCSMESNKTVSLILVFLFLPHGINTKCTLRVDDDLIQKNFTHFVTTNSTKHLTVMLEFGNSKPNSVNWSTVPITLTVHPLTKFLFC